MRAKERREGQFLPALRGRGILGRILMKMTLRSYAAEEIRAKLAANATLRAFEVRDNAGHADVLIGKSMNDVKIDLAVYHGWDDNPKNWILTERGWESSYIVGVDDIWLMDPDTSLPVGWSLREISRDEIKSYLESYRSCSLR